MVWLIIDIVKDRPGLLNDITYHVRLRNLNIRSVVGTRQVVLMEVEGEVDNELLRELSGVDGVGLVTTITQSFRLLGFVQEAFMNAVLFYVMKRDPGLLEALGYEYGKELMRHYMASIKDFRNALYASLRVLTALGLLTLIGIQFDHDRTIISIREAFDEEVGMPMTRGIIRGLFDSVGRVRHSIDVVRRNSQYDFVIS
ncbi:MAG: amino acid-binding protein [Vulcanisaeta sp.]|nr:amino acid-binding protein [Vulcanisaeta sp.]